MRFYTNDRRTAGVKWYFVPDGTPPLPFPTVFNNADWDEFNGAGSLLGEDESSARGAYYLGGDPTNASGQGPPCGTPDQWLNGMATPPSPPTPLNVFKTPVCCPTKFSPFIHHQCQGADPHGAWDTYHMSLSGIGGAEGAGAFFNTDWQLAYLSNCIWYQQKITGLGLDENTIQAELSTNFSAGWNLTLFVQGTESANYALPFGVDISQPFTLPLVFDNGNLTNLPATVTLYPGYPDMPLIGSLVTDAGVDAIPSLYLLCDGRPVSRAQYSLLFGRIATTYGAGDGVTTFNLPDLRGKVLVGSGGAYTTGQAVGNDSPTLVANNLPAHTHPVTDPGHIHPTPSGQGAFVCNANTLNQYNSTGANAGGRSFQTGSNTTGITQADANVTTNAPIDVRQAGVAVRPLIYAGQ